MADFPQWSVNQLLGQLANIKSRAQAEFTAIGENNRAVADLYAQTDRITDPQERAVARAGLEAWATRQVKLQNDFNAGYARYRNAYNAAATFLRSIGLKAPADPGLSGMGAAAIVIVPVAVIGAVIVAGLWLGAVHDNNVTQRQALSQQAARFNAFLGGQITREDYLAISNAEAELAEKNKKKPPGEDWTKMVIPALALVALIVIGPQILRMVPQRKGAAA